MHGLYEITRILKSGKKKQKSRSDARRTGLLIAGFEDGDHEPKNVGGLLRQNFVKETDFPETNTPAGTLILAHANCVGLLT